MAVSGVGAGAGILLAELIAVGWQTHDQRIDLRPGRGSLRRCLIAKTPLNVTVREGCWDRSGPFLLCDVVKKRRGEHDAAGILVQGSSIGVADERLEGAPHVRANAALGMPHASVDG